MKRVSQIQLLGDSILKGIQVEPATGRYVTRNEIGIPGLERDFGLTVKNGSHFGATVVKGERLLERLLERETPCDAVVMDFGGNDCDFRWDQVAADPEGDHRPNVPLEEFLGRYREMIAQLRLHGITPVLTTLPPLEPERFFSWWCGKLDQAAVRRWLGSLTNIYAHQENYPGRWASGPGDGDPAGGHPGPSWLTATLVSFCAGTAPTPTPPARRSSAMPSGTLPGASGAGPADGVRVPARRRFPAYL